MYKIGSMPHSIPIGYTGETNFRSIEIDMTAWMDKMPAGVPSIVHIRPGEEKEDAYVAVTEFDRETGILSWTITAADIGTLEGEGEMQVWLEETENDTVNKRGKSVIVKTKVIEAANSPDENVPTSQEAFIEQVTSLKTQTVTAKEAAEDAQAAAEDAQEAAEQAAEDAENVNLHPAYIDGTTKHWMVYDADNHQYVDTQIKAQGEDGQDGQDATPTLVCPAYADLTFPVSKDTLCYKDGTLYKAKQDISTSEAWTAAHWDATNLATEQRLLKNHIQGVEGSVKSKAPAIYSDTEETETHTGLTNSQKVTFKGNAKAFKTARIANKGNIHPVNTKTETKSGVTSVTSGRFTVVDGTATGNNGFETVDKSITECPAGTYKFLMEIDKHESNVKINGYLNFGINYSGQSGYSYPVVEHITNNRTKIETQFTATSAFNKIRLMFPIVKDSVYDNYTFWIGVYPSDVTIIDTEENVPSEGEYTYDLSESMTIIDTMQHKSVVTDVVDTKTYVDSKEIDVSQKLVYISPEMFGAKGNGYSDDTNALNACIAYAMNGQSTPRAAIRGFGKYRTTTGITMHGAHIDAYFNEIIYTGNDAAVTLIGSYSKFIFNRIVATEGGSNAIGIWCTTAATPVYQYDGFYCNYVECNYIISNGNTVELLYPSSAHSEGIYYSVLKFRNQYSYNGNVIAVHGSNIGEIDIYGKAVTAQNGYLFYAPGRMNNTTHQQIRLHQYGFENGLKNGVYGNVALLECRTRELMDKREANTDTGYLFVFDGVVPCSYKDNVAGDVDITAIKATNAKSFQDVVNDAISRAESGGSEYSVWYTFGIEGQSYAELKNCVRAVGGHLRTQAMLPPGDIYVYYQHVAYKPHDEWYRLIDDDFTTGQAANLDFITPTVFDIDTASVDINLDYSYCCIAINEFRVIQHESKTAIVYDKLGNKIFDGSELGAGTFVFRCSRVPLDGFTIEYGDNQTMTAPASYVRRVYTGENEKWTITKEATIDLQ